MDLIYYFAAVTLNRLILNMCQRGFSRFEPGGLSLGKSTFWLLVPSPEPISVPKTEQIQYMRRKRKYVHTDALKKNLSFTQTYSKPT